MCDGSTTYGNCLSWILVMEVWENLNDFLTFKVLVMTALQLSGIDAENVSLNAWALCYLNKTKSYLLNMTFMIHSYTKIDSKMQDVKIKQYKSKYKKQSKSMIQKQYRTVQLREEWQ